MATWQEFEDQAPELAAEGRRLLYQYGPGLGFLATVRKDGGPRLHPFCPVLAEGGLWGFILRESPKCHDLLRDGRYAAHAFPSDEVDDEFYVTGRAVSCDDDLELRERVRAATTATVGAPEEMLFRLDVDRALSANYTHRGQWPPAYRRWRDPISA
jgi:hypothetical protein